MSRTAFSGVRNASGISWASAPELVIAATSWLTYSPSLDSSSENRIAPAIGMVSRKYRPHRLTPRRSRRPSKNGIVRT